MDVARHALSRLDTLLIPNIATEVFENAFQKMLYLPHNSNFKGTLYSDS